MPAAPEALRCSLAGVTLPALIYAGYAPPPTAAELVSDAHCSDVAVNDIKSEPALCAGAGSTLRRSASEGKEAGPTRGVRGLLLSPSRSRLVRAVMLHNMRRQRQLLQRRYEEEAAIAIKSIAGIERCVDSLNTIADAAPATLEAPLAPLVGEAPQCDQQGAAFPVLCAPDVFSEIGAVMQHVGDAAAAAAASAAAAAVSGLEDTWAERERLLAAREAAVASWERRQKSVASSAVVSADCGTNVARLR
jgi:hypothetical protein